MADEGIKPFDSFLVAYKVLVWAGCYKLQNKPKSRWKWICHQIYRFFVFFMVVGYNVTHIVFIIESRHNINDVFDSLLIGIPQINLVVKMLTFYLQSSRIDEINMLLNDPLFAADSKKDEELLKENKRIIHCFHKVACISICIVAIIWPLSHFVRRYQDPTAVVPVFTPFETDTWATFSVAVLVEVIPPLWNGVGHLTLDSVITTYYAQAEVQLKIIKYNLEHLFDATTKIGGDSGRQEYKHIVNGDLQIRFVHYVQRFEILAWYIKEISKIFNGAMSFQFFSSTAALCVVTFRMSFVPVISVQFIFFAVVFILMVTQVFLYCYCGNMVQYESQSVTTSIYLSNWVSASPKFHRMLLIAMCRWSCTLTPTIIGIVPLSLDTFVSILKSAYTLYAVLNTRQQ